jgi:hypothetical protein
MHNLICDLWAIIALVQYALWEMIVFEHAARGLERNLVDAKTN